jgi:hypothetical protein
MQQPGDQRQGLFEDPFARRDDRFAPPPDGSGMPNVGNVNVPRDGGGEIGHQSAQGGQTAAQEAGGKKAKAPTDLEIIVLNKRQQ